MLVHFHRNDLPVITGGLFLRDTAATRNTINSSRVFMDDQRVENSFAGYIERIDKPGGNPTFKRVVSYSGDYYFTQNRPIQNPCCTGYTLYGPADTGIDRISIQGGYDPG
jgi:hypothetical protein